VAVEAGREPGDRDLLVGGRVAPPSGSIAIPSDTVASSPLAKGRTIGAPVATTELAPAGRNRTRVTEFGLGPLEVPETVCTIVSPPGVSEPPCGRIANWKGPAVGFTVASRLPCPSSASVCPKLPSKLVLTNKPALWPYANRHIRVGKT
jgi:hypothetical protein